LYYHILPENTVQFSTPYSHFRFELATFFSFIYFYIYGCYTFLLLQTVQNQPVIVLFAPHSRLYQKWFKDLPMPPKVLEAVL